MYTDADTYTCPRCDEVKDNANTYEAACTSCGVCGDCVPTSGGCGSSELCEECGGGDDDKETDTAHLYEDNAGGLTVEHQGVVYRDLEHMAAGVTFARLAKIMRGDVDGDLRLFVSSHPVDEYDILVATYTAGVVEIVGKPGVAACRLLGLDPSKTETLTLDDLASEGADQAYEVIDNDHHWTNQDGDIKWIITDTDPGNDGGTWESICHSLGHQPTEAEWSAFADAYRAVIETHIANRRAT